MREQGLAPPAFGAGDRFRMEDRPADRNLDRLANQGGEEVHLPAHPYLQVALDP